MTSDAYIIMASILGGVAVFLVVYNVMAAGAKLHLETAGDDKNAMVTSVAGQLGRPIAQSSFMKKHVKHLQRMLLLADKPYGAAEAYGFMIMSAVIGTFVTFVVMMVINLDLLYVAIITLTIGPMSGYAVYTMELSGAAKERNDEIRGSFTFVIELIALCVEAGMDFTESMRVVCKDFSPDDKKMRKDAPGRYHIAKLFSEVLYRISLGTPRAQALKVLEERTDLKEVHAFTNAIIICDQMGGEIVGSLKVIAKEAKERLALDAEEFIAKAPLFMMLLMFIFIFPVAGVLIVAPVIMTIMQSGF